jgi:hypothetical protein
MTTKNIKEIITLQNYCKSIIQELYNHESRPYESFVENYQVARIDEAIQLEIFEHDSFDDELSLSADTEEYYRTRLGQNSETNIGYIDEKLNKLNGLLQIYNIRVKSGEDTFKDIKAIYKLLNQIPSMLRQNLKALSSNSVFTFKNEPNFEIKMINLEICKKEIQQLSDALDNLDRVMDEEWNFFRSMDDVKINFSIRKIKRNSAELEKSFAKLHEDILNFINQSIKDGEFIKHLKKLKQLKDDNILSSNTNIDELVKKKFPIIANVKEKKILPDDKMYAYVEKIQEILKSRETKVINDKVVTAIDYDFTKKSSISKKLYNYPKINCEFLAQDRDLMTFLLEYPIKIEDEKLMGIFVRLLKNYAFEYDIEDSGKEKFIQVDDRAFLKVFSKKRGKQSGN